MTESGLRDRCDPVARVQPHTLSTMSAYQQTFAGRGPSDLQSDRYDERGFGSKQGTTAVEGLAWRSCFGAQRARQWRANSIPKWRAFEAAPLQRSATVQWKPDARDVDQLKRKYEQAVLSGASHWKLVEKWPNAATQRRRFLLRREPARPHPAVVEGDGKRRHQR